MPGSTEPRRLELEKSDLRELVSRTGIKFPKTAKVYHAAGGRLHEVLDEDRIVVEWTPAPEPPELTIPLFPPAGASEQPSQSNAAPSGA